MKLSQFMWDLSELNIDRLKADNHRIQVQKMLDEVIYRARDKWDLDKNHGNSCLPEAYPVLTVAGFSLDLFTGIKDKDLCRELIKFLETLLRDATERVTQLENDFEDRITLHFKENSK